MSCFFFFVKQKTAYEMRISDWSSDVCSSDLQYRRQERAEHAPDQCFAPNHIAQPDDESIAPCLRRGQCLPDRTIQVVHTTALRLQRRGACLASLIADPRRVPKQRGDRKSTRLNSSH